MLRGAPFVDIIAMLNIGNIKLILVSAVISIPLAWTYMNLWLGNFEYRIEISPRLFLISFVLALLLSIVTVCYHTWKASGINSAKALKYE